MLSLYPTTSDVKTNFHYYSVLHFPSWFLWPVNYLGICVYRFLFLGKFGVLLLFLCLFACLRFTFRSLLYQNLFWASLATETFLLIKIQAHQLFIRAQTHYTQLVIHAPALLWKEALSPAAPRGRRGGGTQAWLRRPALDSSWLRSHCHTESCSNDLVGSVLPRHAHVRSGREARPLRILFFL